MRRRLRAVVHFNFIAVEDLHIVLNCSRDVVARCAILGALARRFQVKTQLLGQTCEIIGCIKLSGSERAVDEEPGYRKGTVRSSNDNNLTRFLVSTISFHVN